MKMLPPEHRKFIRMWLEFISERASAGTAASREAAPGDAAMEMFDSLFQGPNQIQFMRSPEFVEMAKQAMDMTMALRQQTSDTPAETQRPVRNAARPDLETLLTADWVM